MSGPQVPRAPLGNTGLEVPVIGFGASPLGGVFEVRCTNLDYPVSHGSRDPSTSNVLVGTIVGSSSLPR
jgi:hypothetical protein